MTDPQLEAAIAPDLLDDERVLWAARPDPQRLLCSADALLIPFFGAVAVLGIVGMFVNELGAIGIVYALVPVTFSLYLSIGRLFVKRWRKRNTIYALTDRRVLFLTRTARGASTVAMRLDLLPTYTYIRRAGGAGDIIFGSNSGMSRALANAAVPWWYNFTRTPAPPAFYDLTDAEEPKQILVRCRPDL